MGFNSSHQSDEHGDDGGETQNSSGDGGGDGAGDGNSEVNSSSQNGAISGCGKEGDDRSGGGGGGGGGGSDLSELWFTLGFRNGKLHVPLQGIHARTNPEPILDAVKTRWLLSDQVKTHVIGLKATLKAPTNISKKVPKTLRQEKKNDHTPARRIFWSPTVFLQANKIYLTTSSGRQTLIDTEWSKYSRTEVLNREEKLEQSRKKRAEAMAASAAARARAVAEEQAAHEEEKAAHESRQRGPLSSCPVLPRVAHAMRCPNCWLFEAIASACIEIPSPRPPPLKSKGRHGDAKNGSACFNVEVRQNCYPISLVIPVSA